MQKRNLRFLTALMPAAVAALVFASGNAHGQDESWGTSGSLGYYQPIGPQKVKKLKIYEVHASLAAQPIGVALPGPVRTPIGLRVMAGVNLFKFKSDPLGGRVLHGPFVTVPFSIEIGYLSDMVQFGPGIGWQFSGRPSQHWKWFFDIQAAVAANGGIAGGPGVHLGFVYYFLSGFGLFGDADIESYFGKESAFTVGLSVGLIMTYEIFKLKEKVIE
jgi:hypothetical protein